MVLRDEDGRMDFAEVSSPAAAGRFVPAPADLRLGTTDGAVWLRFDIVRDAGAADHWLFEVVAPQLDYVALYDS
ncbi:7TM-DISM domain-containing protein, partial [Acinetobacter baumannii]